MADSVGYFQILNPDLQDRDGRFTARDANEIRNGILVTVTPSGDTLDACDAGDTPRGFAYTDRTSVFSPTTVYAAAGEPVTLVRGANMRFAADLYSFSAGALPAVGDNLYTGANGLIATSGSAAGYFGKCIGTDDVRSSPNTTQNLVVCEAKFLF